MQYILKIKDLEIPFSIKNYKTAKTMKIYFKEDGLVITKSPYIPKREVDKFIKQNEEKIYENYKKIEEKKHLKKERWETGQTILYHGKEYIMYKTYHQKDIIRIKIDEENDIFRVISAKRNSKRRRRLLDKNSSKKAF